MKNIFLLIILFVGVVSVKSVNAQANNITSTGLELREVPTPNAYLTNVAVGNFAIARLKIVNSGTQPGGSYPIGVVKAVVTFVEEGFNSHYFKYDGPATFNTAKFSWVYDAINAQLVGINTVAFATGVINTEIVDVQIKGIKVTLLPSSSISDLPLQLSLINNPTTNNPNDDYHTLRIDVVAPSGSVLPVTLTNFEAFADKCNAKIKWSTSNETNLKKYEVEVSKNGLSFEKAGTLNPSVANTGIYEFNTNQGTGKAYYRLKIIDKDGSVTYSKIVTVNANCTDKIVKLFPNPVKLDQLLNVNLTGYDASVKADLYSATGQLVKSYILRNGANNLSVENLAQGFYTLRVMENGAVAESFKLNVLK